MDERERIFFEHDLATPLSNLRGADFLLRAGLRGAAPPVAEPLDILSHGIHHLERMLHWYWRVRDIDSELEPVAPWPVADLPELIRHRMRDEGSPLEPPTVEGTLAGWTAVPPQPLILGLAGAGETLGCAAGETPRAVLSEENGVLTARFEVTGDAQALDPARLFRKFYWGAAEVGAGRLDAGFPYLEAVLNPFGGHLELAWQDGVWTLLATLPLAPAKGGP